MRPTNLQLDPGAPPQLGYRAMKRPLSLALVIVLVCCAACERPGEGTSERELAAKVLTGVLAYPHSTLTGVSAGQDAAQATFTTPAPLPRVAAWYRETLKLNEIGRASCRERV